MYGRRPPPPPPRSDRVDTLRRAGRMGRDYEQTERPFDPTRAREHHFAVNAEHDRPTFPVGSQVYVSMAYVGSGRHAPDAFTGGPWYVVGTVGGRHDWDYKLARHPGDDYDVMVTPARVFATRAEAEARSYAPNARSSGSADETAGDELLLYLDNIADLAPGGPSGQGHDIVKNLLRKWRKGTYDQALAPKLWGYLVESAAKRYAKEFGSSEREWSTMFTPATRRYVAQQLADRFYAEMQAGEWDHMDTSMRRNTGGHRVCIRRDDGEQATVHEWCEHNCADDEFCDFIQSLSEEPPGTTGVFDNGAGGSNTFTVCER